MFTLKEDILKYKSNHATFVQDKVFYTWVSFQYKFINHSNEGMPYKKVQKKGGMILSFPWINFYRINSSSAIWLIL